jgi:uncharacterized protein with GYD domain
MKPPVISAVESLEANDRRLAAFRDMFRSEGWRILKEYLESRYIELNQKSPDSVRGLADRNGRMAEIRGIFNMIGYEFNERERLLEEIRILEEQDVTLPSPTVFSP